MQSLHALFVVEVQCWYSKVFPGIAQVGVQGMHSIVPGRRLPLYAPKGQGRLHSVSLVALQAVFTVSPTGQTVQGAQTLSIEYWPASQEKHLRPLAEHAFIPCPGPHGRHDVQFRLFFIPQGVFSNSVKLHGCAQLEHTRLEVGSQGPVSYSFGLQLVQSTHWPADLYFPHGHVTAAWPCWRVPCSALATCKSQSGIK